KRARGTGSSVHDRRTAGTSTVTPTAASQALSQSAARPRATSSAISHHLHRLCRSAGLGFGCGPADPRCRVVRLADDRLQQCQAPVPVALAETTEANGLAPVGHREVA